MISPLLIAIGVTSVGVGTPTVIASREEVHEGKLYDVFLAPPCSNKSAICDPWERVWTDAIKTSLGEIVTPEGLILREKTNA